MDRYIILLNGPSSSGKSTLSRALRLLIEERRSERYEIVSIDDHMKISTSETIYEDDVYEISGEMCEKIREHFDAGYGVIIDHVITSERIFEQLIEALSPHRVFLVRVTCPIEILRKREQERGDRCAGSAEASDTYLYPKEGYDMTVDTGSKNPSEIAREVLNELFRE